MKKILLSTLALAFYAGASAQLKLTENFGGMTGTTLGTQNSWVQNGSGNDVGLVVLSNNTGALVYPGYGSGQSYVTVNDVNGIDPHKTFTAIPTSGTDPISSVFISFVVRASSAEGTNNPDYSISLRNTATSLNICRFFMENDGSGTPANNLEFGISRGADNPGTVTNGNYLFGTTYLVVMRYDFNPSGSDAMYLWINPSNFPAEPATGSATLSVLGGGDLAFGNQINALTILQQGTDGPEAAFDAFRVASNGANQGTVAANASAAWFNLTAAGIPLPATLGSIKAYEKQTGIQIDWTSLTEINLSHYDIERSADGRNFTAIGQVTAANTTSARNYGFFDANPLPGTSYYRLRNVDIDAKSEYSTVLRVSLDKSIKDVRLYPNPVTTGYVAFQSSDLAKGEYAAKIFNVSGQQVQLLKFTHTGGSINQTIQLPATIKSGMFTLVVEKSGEKVITKPFVVQ